MQCAHCDVRWPDELAPQLRFCGACGHALPVVASPDAPLIVEGQRLPATLLSVGIVGFTDFTEQRPPAEVSVVLGDFLHLLGGVIVLHAGAIDRIAGDSLLATFGLPHADPTASRNAVHAALALLAVSAEHAERARLPFRLRIGVHAGEVAYRTVGDARAAFGEAIHHVLRVQAAAAPGKVWISRPVYQEVRRFFAVEPHPALELRAQAPALPVYEVIDERTQLLVDVPRFVGREGEWERLQLAAREVFEQRQLRVVALRGATGAGKSRLAWELREKLEAQEGTRLDVVQYDHSARFPAHGLSQLVRGRFDLRANLDEAALLAQLRRVFPREMPFAVEEAERDRAQELFAFALGVLPPDVSIRQLDGKARWEGVYAELKRWLEGWAARGPWIWVLEDAQRGDAETAAFLDWAMHQQWSHPPLILLTVSEDGLGEESAWRAPLQRWRGQPALVELRLKELRPEVLALALASMDPQLSPPLARRIAEHCEGNPRFATELVRFLRDEGKLGAGLEDGFALPATIREVMEARLERLGVDSREVARRGALVGRRFPLAAVARIWSGPEDQLQAGYRRLLESGALYEEPSRLFPDETEAVFRHGLLMEAALERVSRPDRARWLEGLEAWALESLGTAGERWEGRAMTLLPLIARARQAQGRSADASVWLEMLGLLHRRHDRFEEAIEALRQALAHATGARRGVLLRRIAHAEYVKGQFSAALATASEPVPPDDTPPPKVPDALRERMSSLEADPLDAWSGLSADEASLALTLARVEVLALIGHTREIGAMLDAVEQRLGGLSGPAIPQLWCEWTKMKAWLLRDVLGDPAGAKAVCIEIASRFSSQLTSTQWKVLARAQDQLPLKQIRVQG